MGLGTERRRSGGSEEREEERGLGGRGRGQFRGNVVIREMGRMRGTLWDLRRSHSASSSSSSGSAFSLFDGDRLDCVIAGIR